MAFTAPNRCQFVARGFAVLGWSLALLVCTPQARSEPTAAQQLHALLDEDWQWRLRDAPERATMLGDRRYNDKLTNLSPEAIEAREKHARDILERLRSIDRAKLSGQDLLSYDLFRFENELA